MAGSAVSAPEDDGHARAYVARVAVSVVLLTGAGVLTRTMPRLAMVETGMDTEHLLTMEVPRDFGGPQDNPAAIAQYERMQRELSSLPGVRLATAMTTS